LVMHGDLLCSDDLAYQAFRRQVRDPAWRETFLSQPLAARHAFAAQARAASQQHQAGVIVVASHGRGDLTALLLGSVAHQVIHLADRPVLVAR